MKRPSKRRRKSPFRAAVLKKALRQARRWVEKTRLDIGTCIGCKYTKEDRYGKGRSLCIKFHVQQKQDQANPDQAVPEVLLVRHQGRHYRVKTDVVEIGRPRLQAYPVVTSLVNGGAFQVGSPACVLQAQSGAKVLLTAGHVFSLGALNPGLTYSAQLNGQPVGDVWARVSNEFSSGQLTDFAAVEIDPTNYPTQIQQRPWLALNSYFPDDQLDTYPDGYPGAGPLRGGLFGQFTTTRVQLDSVVTQSLIADNNTLNLAPPLYHYRCLDQATQGGDSGSPVILFDENTNALTNTVLGVHVAGYVDSSGAAWGWAVPMERIIELINAQAGQAFDVVPA